MHQGNAPDRRDIALVLLSGLAMALVFLASVPLPRVDGHILGSDGFYYFIQLRSLVMDGDLNFFNDCQLLGINTLRATATGHMHSPWPVGAALLWAPFFLLAHGLSLLLGLPTDGLGPLHQALVCLGGILYATAGSLFAFLAARRAAASVHARDATLFLLWASPAAYYIMVEPSMSHALSLFTQGLALWLLTRSRPDDPARSFIWLGLATGLATLVRFQDGLIAFPPLALLAWRVRRGELPLAGALTRALLFGLTLLLTLTPQFVFWDIVYGSPLLIPHGEGFLHWLGPRPLATLFSPRHGLLLWHPVFLVALAGLPLLWRRDRGLALAAGFVFLAQLYVNSAVDQWWADASFGHRRFVSVLPWLTPALATLLERARAWRSAGRPASDLASRETSRPASPETSHPASRETVRPGSHPASSLASRPTPHVASPPALREPSRPASFRSWLTARATLWTTVRAALWLLVFWNGLAMLHYRFSGLPMNEALSWREFFLGRLEIVFRLAGRLLGG